MKVLYCILDNRFGGPHRLAHSVSLRLREHGIETIFLTGRKTDDVWQPEGTTVFHLRHIQCYRRRHPFVNLMLFCLFLPANVWRIRGIIRSHGIGIVHIDGVTNLVPALAAWSARTPIVWLYNDHLPAVVHRLLLPVVARLSASVIVQGEKLKAHRTRGVAGLEAKTTVLHSCTDPAEFDPARYDSERKGCLKRDLGIPADCAVVGMIGNLNRLKGHAYFIQAAARIKEEVRPVRFVIVGRKLDTAPGYWEQLQRLTTENGLEGDVIYTGFQADVPSLMAIMDVFVLASVLESCPVVVLEAMAMGIPVVATDVGAVSELLANGTAGTIVPIRDPDAIARAVIEDLTGPPQRVRAMTQAARGRVEEVFALDKIADRQKDLYEVVHRRSGRRQPAAPSHSPE
ncbi:MAG: glycosyltransferase family 4 protein [Sedimentisphaerales bacterium]|nr:glycosyltransferase family 4 protein [Sedimentisphaerales bacterium]